MTPYRSAVLALPTGLINYWPQDEVSGLLGCPLTVTGATVQTLHLGKSRLFDGVDDVLTQAELASGHTSATASVADGVTFANLPSITTLSQFAGAAGVNKRFVLVLTDIGGNKTSGYIGAIGTGETYTDLIGGTDPSLRNGNFGAWTGDNPGTWSVSGEVGTNLVTESPAGSCSIIKAESGLPAIYQNLITTAKLYKYSFTLSSISGELVIQGIRSSNVSFTTSGSKSGYSTAQVSGNILFTKSTNGTAVIDNVTLQEVLTPTTSGIILYSTRAGSTQNMAYKHANFNANSLASATIYQSDFWGSFSGGMAIAIPFLSTDTNGVLISKGKSTTSLLSYTLRLESGKLAAYVSGDGATPISAVTSGTYNDGNRHVVVLNYTPSTSLQVWIDGVKQAETTVGVPATLFDSPEPLRFGNNGNNDNPYAGEISDCAMWERPLLQAEIESLTGWGTRTTAGVRAAAGVRTPVVGRTPVVRP